MPIVENEDGFFTQMEVLFSARQLDRAFDNQIRPFRNVLDPNCFKHGKLKLRAGIIIRPFAIARKEAPCVQILTEPARHCLQIFPLDYS